MPVGYLTGVIVQGIVMGAVYGFAFGAAEGIAISEPRKAFITGLLGAGIGAISGGAVTVGASAAMIAAANSLRADYSVTAGVLLPLSRIIAWTAVGCVIGSAEGLRSASRRRVVAGILGGLAGGLIGGAGLEWMIRIISDQSIGRAAGFLIMGMGIGFFLGEVERRFSFARLQVLTGPFRNKEYILSRKRTVIGSGFASDVYLSVYPGTESRHAEIVAEGGQMWVRPADGFVKVNETPAKDIRFLKYQDVIELGRARLLLLPM
jgi:hypothetical protein